MFGAIFSSEQSRIYLDHAAATAVTPEVLKAMEPYWKDVFANPSAIHQEGVQARQVVESARTRLARRLEARPQGVTFTASGTESNHLALIGIVESRHATGMSYEDMEIVAPAIEHPSIAEVLEVLSTRGVRVRTLPVDPEGRVLLAELLGLLSERTVLVTCAYVNGEIGVVQDISGISRVVRQFIKDTGNTIYVHTDAAQAPWWCRVNLPALGADLLSLDAGKCGGPKGVGVLVARHGVKLAPVIVGGGQEQGLRSGTENVPGIVGAVTALELAQEEYQARADKVSMLRDKCLADLLKIEGLEVNGSLEHRVANNINVSIKGVDAEFAVISLDAKGVAIATKSACSGASGGGSAVIRHISGDEERAMTSLRITLGPQTTSQELDFFTSNLTTHIEKVRSMHTNLTQR